MTNEVNLLTWILIIAITIFSILLVTLICIYIYMKLKTANSNKKEKTVVTSEKTESEKKHKAKQYTIDSVFNFMEFDKIEDNMIVQRNGTKYVMVIDCQGINYDLMSYDEKVAVEAGFTQFLNTLTGPLQIYTQTRTINLENSIQSYKEKVNQIETEYFKQKAQYEKMSMEKNVTEQQLKMAHYNYIRQKNLYEYGKDIIYNTEKMSLNKNILSKKYYIAIAYYTTELGQNNFDKEEIREMAFSELYTKAQAIIRALGTTGVVGKIMSSTDLLELLYVAYNRDDSEIYDTDKAIRARYDELYSTAQDYMDKKIKILDKEIEKKAIEKAKQKMLEAKSEKEKMYEEKEESMDEIVSNLAELILEENAENIGEDIAKKAIEKVQEEKKVRGRRSGKAKAE